jgi:agmatine/peptidylarginine deiminase
MPVHIGNGKYVGYNYCPDYLRDDPAQSEYITNQSAACEDVDLEMADIMDVIFDGGNYVRCGEKVLVTDKIFMENPQWRPLRLIERMEEAFQAEVILLPWDMEDECAHADGMVAWLGSNRILMNNYRQLEKGKDKPFTKRVMKILETHFDITELSYDCKIHPDSWCYLNYLETDNGIILPALSETMDCENDLAALELFMALFPQKEVVQVFAAPLIKKGGAIHCITWTLFKQ